MAVAADPKAEASVWPIPNKSLMAIAVETVPALSRQGEGIKNSRRRHRIADLTGFLLRRAATRSTITYRQLVDGAYLRAAPLLNRIGTKNFIALRAEFWCKTLATLLCSDGFHTP
jgi:hypothetical protein